MVTDFNIDLDILYTCDLALLLHHLTRLYMYMCLPLGKNNGKGNAL